MEQGIWFRYRRRRYRGTFEVSEQIVVYLLELYRYCAQMVYTYPNFVLRFFREVHKRFGVVTSFTGTYKADQWLLTLSSQGARILLL